MLLFVSGCGPKYFAKPGTDMSSIKGIAVLPFENFTSDENADEKIRRIVITELLSRDRDVTEPGEITRILKELKIKSISSIKINEIQTIGKTLGVEAVMMGSVEAYGMSKGISVTYPEVTINLRLIAVSSGAIIWSIRHTAGGADFWTRHFGSEGLSLSEAAGKVVREALDTFFRL
jgi:TolB-like protein